MYAGHIGIAVAATARRPDVPVAAFIGASLLPDLAVHSFAHTAPGVVLLISAAAIVGAARWDGEVGALLGTLVTLHFAADLVTSNLDVIPGSDVELGLGLYDLPLADFALEGAVIVLGWIAWRSSLPSRSGRAARPMLTLLLASQAAFAAFVAGTANDR